MTCLLEWQPKLQKTLQDGAIVMSKPDEIIDDSDRRASVIKRAFFLTKGIKNEMEKLGLIFDPREHCDWATTHAWVPTPSKCWHLINAEFIFAGRNAENLSQLGAFLIDLINPDRVFEVTESPLITLGPLGSFDDSAILPSCIVNLGENKLLLRWLMQGKRVPYYAAIGLAVSQDGGKSFKKQGKGPVLARNEIDPFFTASNYILIENGLWRMWYTSNTGWKSLDGKVIPRYHIKYMLNQKTGFTGFGMDRSQLTLPRRVNTQFRDHGCFTKMICTKCGIPSEERVIGLEFLV